MYRRCRLLKVILGVPKFLITSSYMTPDMIIWKSSIGSNCGRVQLEPDNIKARHAKKLVTFRASSGSMRGPPTAPSDSAGLSFRSHRLPEWAEIRRGAQAKQSADFSSTNQDWQGLGLVITFSFSLLTCTAEWPRRCLCVCLFVL